MSNKFWICVFGGAALISAVAAFMLLKGPANMAVVYQNGELIRRLDLASVAQPYSFTVECEEGINIIAVETGRIRVSEADCPDRSCVRQGWISGGTAPIVCLPHRLVIRLENPESPIADAVARWEL